MSERRPETVHWARTVVERTVERVRRVPSYWLLAVILGLGAGVVGPFGTYLSFPIGFRLLYWQTIFIVSFGLWRLLELAQERFFGPMTFPRRELVVGPAYAVVNSTHIYGVHAAIAAATGGPMYVSWPMLVLSHLGITFGVVTPAIWIVLRMRAGASAPVEPVDAEPAPGPAGGALTFLTDKLSPSLRGARPFALAAEGHYVRVYTGACDELVTMRFEDALAAVDGIAGVRTHRSWWVAIEAVDAMRKAGSAYEVVLASGLTAPVGRRRRAAVAEALGRPS
ncbi:MAG: LytTR family DNA-binding domain-containing protein [Pseudomonadota bacterium]